MIRILIAENIPSLNKGEMTIFDGMVESFQNLGKFKISMFSDHPEIDLPRYGNKAHIINISAYTNLKKINMGLLNKFILSFNFLGRHIIFIFLYKLIGQNALGVMKDGLWKEYLDSSIIIIGHNGSFGLGGGLGIPILFYPIFIPYFCKKIKKPVVLYAGSINRKKQNFLYDYLYKFALDRIDLITLRERESLQNSISLGSANTNIHVTADLAFLSKPVSNDVALGIMEREILTTFSRPLIGITVTQSVASKSFKDMRSDESYEKHNAIFGNIIDKLIEKTNATVVFIPHCIGLGEDLDDRLIATDIYNSCKNQKKIRIITNEYGAAELKGLIGQFDLFIGERLHSVINALSMSVPSIFISDRSDSRLGIMDLIGEQHSILFSEELNEWMVIEKSLDFITNKHCIKVRIKDEIVQIEKIAALNGALLKKLLDNYSP